MRAPRRSVSLLVVALLAAGCAWLLLRGTASESGDPGVRRDVPPPEGAGEPLAAPSLTAAPEAVARRGAKPRWTLTVTLDGWRRDVAREALVSVYAVTRLGLMEDAIASAPCSGDAGTLTLDVSALAEHPEWHTLSVTAAAEHHLGAGAPVALSEDAEARARGGALEARLVLTPAAMVTGRVVDARGNGVASALHVMRRNRHGVVHALARASSDLEGRFALDVPPGQGLWVNASESQADDGWRSLLCARWGPFDLAERQSVDVGTLVLPDGLALDVRLVGRLGARGFATARARSPERERPCFYAGDAGQVDLADVLLGEARASRPGDGPGRVRVGGLWPGSWRVQANVMDWGCALGHEVAWAGSTIVEVPRDALELDVRRALQRVVVRDDAGPVQGATVVLEAAHALAFLTDEAGHGAVVLPPATRQRVRVLAPGHVTRVEELTTAADGEEATLEVALERGATTVPSDLDWAWTPPVTLTLRVLDEASQQALPARVAVFDETDTRLSLRWLQRANVVTWLVEDRLLELGEASCVDVLPSGELTFVAECEGYEPDRTKLRGGVFPRGARNVDLWLRRSE